MKKKTTRSIITLILITLVISCSIDPPPFPPLPSTNFKLVVAKATESDMTGTISAASTASGSYKSLTSISVEAVADEGSFFLGWYDAAEGGRLISKKAKYEFLIAMDTTLYARFYIDKDITFDDPILDKIIREKIKKPSGQLTRKDVAFISYLSHNGTSGDTIANLKGIEYLTELSHLLLSNNQITDISPLANMTRVTNLSLQNNGGLIDITPISNMKKMTVLHLNDNQITDITALANMTELTSLSMQNNLIADISPLTNLTKLTFLHLFNNQIGELAAIANMQELTTLQLTNNQISDISPLTKLTKLTFLSLSSNRIVDIEAVANMQEIATLQLAKNQIVDITPITNLTKISYLQLRENLIKDITPIINNPGIGKGDSIFITGGNPLTSDDITALQATGADIW